MCPFRLALLYDATVARLFIVWTQIIFLLIGSASAQTPPADRIRQDVGKIGVLGEITVYVKDGREFYGSVGRIGPDDFTVADVDQKRDVTLRFDEVRKIAKGYGRGHTITGRRIPPKRKLITTLIVVGGLLTLVIVAVATDRS